MFLFLHITFNIIVLVGAFNEDGKVKEKMKQMIEEAGCPFVSTNQLLVRSVCLIPYYQSNEAPMGTHSFTTVNIYLQEVSIIEIDEMRNKITIQMSQDLQWLDQRIRANFSAVPLNINLIKLAPKNFFEIWHPDLDLYIPDLLEWDSVKKPNLFKDVSIMGDNESQDNTITDIIDLNENYKDNRIKELKLTELNKEDNEKHKKFIRTIPNSIWSKIVD